MASVEVKVPDIGDFKEVEVIELLVKPGDTVAVDQSLLTVESDKASMEIPSSHAGVVKELKVKLGDKVAMGSLVLVLESAAVAAAPPPAATPAPVQAAFLEELRTKCSYALLRSRCIEGTRLGNQTLELGDTTAAVGARTELDADRFNRFGTAFNHRTDPQLTNLEANAHDCALVSCALNRSAC